MRQIVKKILDLADDSTEVRFPCTLNKGTLKLLRKYCLIADTTVSQALQKILDENLEC